MAKRLGLKLRMYSLYETGKYDKSEGDVRRENLLLKLTNLGKPVDNSQAEPSNKPETGALGYLIEQLKAKDELITQLANRIDVLSDHIIFLTGSGDREAKPVRKPIVT